MVTGDGIISDMGDLKAHTQLLGLLQSYPPIPEAKSSHRHLGAWREKIQESLHFMGCPLNPSACGPLTLRCVERVR